MHPELRELRAGDAVLQVWPEVGGALVGWRKAGLPLLRPVPLEMMGQRDARRLGAFTLVPFSNRIGWGRFGFGGREYAIRRNTPDHRHPIHGNGWERPWTVQAAAGASLQLGFAHEAVGEARAIWPFSFRAENRIVLTPDQLTVTLSVENTGPETMPAGLGLHPFFPLTPDTELSFRAGDVWINDAANLPAERTPIPDRWRCDPARLAQGLGLDNCFNAWQPPVRIGWPERRLSLTMEADKLFGHLVVYVPEGKPYFATEPVSHMNDGVNHPEQPDNGVRALAPGERMTGTIRFQVGEG